MPAALTGCLNQPLRGEQQGTVWSMTAEVRIQMHIVTWRSLSPGLTKAQSLASNSAIPLFF
jgi:hypothetical protein